MDMSNPMHAFLELTVQSYPALEKPAISSARWNVAPMPLGAKGFISLYLVLFSSHQPVQCITRWLKRRVRIQPGIPYAMLWIQCYVLLFRTYLPHLHEKLNCKHFTIPSLYCFIGDIKYCGSD